MEKSGEKPISDKIERKDADYTGYSEKQADLNMDKGFTTSSSSGQAGKKGGQKAVTVFQAIKKILEF